MATLAEGWRIQTRVISALMIRELNTRFGRENIGFLWIMVEPLMFALLVGVMWRFIHGPTEHGMNIIGFVATGYIPLTMFRNAANRSVGLFTANSGLMYHRQIKLVDFVLVRCLIEFLGSSMAFFVVGVLLVYLGILPVPSDIGLALCGWLLYGAFTTTLCMILTPLSELSDVLEKIMPLSTYLMIPFSGTFNMMSWLGGGVREVLSWSPPVNAMEMLRAGLFGSVVTPYYEPAVPVFASLAMLLVGLVACRRIRRRMVVE